MELKAAIQRAINALESGDLHLEDRRFIYSIVENFETLVDTVDKHGQPDEYVDLAYEMVGEVREAAEEY